MKKLIMLLLFTLVLLPSTAWAYNGDGKASGILQGKMPFTSSSGLVDLQKLTDNDLSTGVAFTDGKEVVYDLGAEYDVLESFWKVSDKNYLSFSYLDSQMKDITTTYTQPESGIWFTGVTVNRAKYVKIKNFSALKTETRTIYEVDIRVVPAGARPTPTPSPTPVPTPTPTPPPDTTPPAKPIGLTGTGADKQAVLKWTSNKDPDLAGYNVYQDGSKVATSSTAATTIDGLKNGKTYSFAVSAYDKSGNESAKSVAVNVTPNDKIDVVAIPNMDSIILQISGGTKPYSVQWGSGNDTVNTTQFTITGLTAETNYTVTVTDANGLKWTSTINTGKDKGYVPPTMPNPQELFQRMIDVFGTAGTIAIAVIGGAVLLGIMCLLALWGWRLLKQWLSRAK